MRLISVMAAAASAAFVSFSAATAATIEFTDFVSNDAVLVTPTVTVEEQTGGFKVTVGISNTTANMGLLSGVFFDLSDAISQTDISFPITIENFANNTTNVGNGVNLNGLTSDAFDVGIGFAQTSISPAALMFVVSDLSGALILSDWTRVGLRFQTVGANGDSDKLMSSTVSDVPVPGGVWLMGAGLAGFFGASRRKKKA